jgi:carboxymethylenebutenolidase
LNGVIGFYGRVAEREPGDQEAPIRQVKHYRCPVLGLFGGADAGITAEDVEAFRAALTEARVENEIVVYPGLPHSFFDRTFAQYREECGHAWSRILGFIEANG